MKRVLITQRVDYISNRNETREGTDVRFSKIVWDMGFLPLPVSSAVADKESYIKALAPDAILLTGGNDIGASAERDAMESVLLNYAKAACVPVFGICRGMQVMNVYQGGSLSTIDAHAATRHNVSGALWSQEREVNSYHNSAIFPENLGSSLEILAKAPDGTVEAMHHLSLPWLAIMWHPEREINTKVGDLEMIKKHFDQI